MKGKREEEHGFASKDTYVCIYWFCIFMVFKRARILVNQGTIADYIFLVMMKMNNVDNGW